MIDNPQQDAPSFCLRPIPPVALAACALIAATSLLTASALAAPAAKVQICHFPPGNPDNWHTIEISKNALVTHIEKHGDLLGPCNAFCASFCDDDNACTIDDTGDCEENGCPAAPEAVDCNDSNACTADSCNPATGCEYTALTGTTCTVANPGTCEQGTGSCDSSGACDPDRTPGCCLSTAECEAWDNNACTKEECIETACVTTSTVTCETDACHMSVCIKSTGECTPPEEIVCPDHECHNNGCDPETGCYSNIIEGCCVSDLECDDANNCTTDMCLGVDGCVNAPCASGDACNVLVDCDPLTCAPQTEPETCEDDGDLCTVESCVDGLGCVSDPVDCPEGEACNPDTGACETDCFSLTQHQGLGAELIPLCIQDCVDRAGCPAGICEAKAVEPYLTLTEQCIGDGILEACEELDQLGRDSLCTNICPPPPTCANSADGDPCDADGLEGSCESGECVPDDATVGTDFALVFQNNEIFDSPGPPELTLFVSGAVASTGVVEIPGLGFSQSFSVVPGTITAVAVPTAAMISTSDVIEVEGAMRVTSDNPIRIYGLNRLVWTTDAFAALPIGSLGQNYRVMAWPGRSSDSDNRSQFAIAATEDGTTVTITPKATSGARTAGVPYTIALNRLDAYQLVSGGDLTGTLIESDAPIAVFGGHQCGYVPTTYDYCDHLVEQMPPIDMWGTEALSVPLATRIGGDSFRTLAAQDNTTVVLDGPVPGNITLNAGQFVDVVIDGYNRITADGPILVAQYSNGSTFDNVVSDPFMIVLPPAQRFLSSYTFTTPNSGFPANFVNVVARATDVAAGMILLDGAPISAASFTPFPSSLYSGAQVPISLGTHTLEAANPLGMYVYGYASYDSYGYSGGFSAATP